jgi:hypothetical protein
VRLEPIKRIAQVFAVKRPGNNRLKLVLISIATVLLLFVHFGYYSMYILYLYGRPFCMNALMVSLISSAQALCIILLTSLAVRFKRQMDTTYLPPIIGTLALAVDLSIFGLAKVVWLLYAGLSFFDHQKCRIHILFCSLLYSFSRLYWKSVLCHTTCASIQNNQASRGERLRHCVYWRGHHRVNRSTSCRRCI